MGAPAGIRHGRERFGPRVGPKSAATGIRTNRSSEADFPNAVAGRCDRVKLRRPRQVRRPCPVRLDGRGRDFEEPVRRDSPNDRL